ncbi:Heterokaryon incompatibility protein 6, OR allele, partial [Pseudocercospora fuligena]
MARSCDETCPLRTESEPASGGTTRLRSHEALDQAYVAKDLYQPIREWQTRVLVLKEGEFNTDLVADLVTVDLFAKYAVFHEAQEKTKFTALSYTWGEPRFTQRLILNGLPYSITENLYFFLQRCRQLTDIRVLWVDAVCINQHDDKEKSVQVANMINIYKYASDVMVWLGETGDESDLALDYLNYAKGRAMMRDRKCKSGMASSLTALRALYQRPSTSWDDFSMRINDVVRDLAEQVGIPEQDTSTALSQIAATSLGRRRLNELAEEKQDSPNDVLGRPGPEIVGALNQSCHCQCTNERDRVYGIIGMTTTNVTTASETEHDPLQLRLDYSLSVAQVFTDVARYVMRREGSVSSILCLRAHFGGDGLPSWVPNWRHKTSYKPFQLLERCIRGDMLQHDTRSVPDGKGLLLANDPRLAIVPWSGPLSTSAHELQMRGCIIASLTSEAPPGEIVSIRLVYRSKDHPNRQFRNRGELEDDLDRIVANHLDLASDDRKARYWLELQKSDMIRIETSGKRLKKPIVLHREDVVVKQRSRLVAPVS